MYKMFITASLNTILQHTDRAAYGIRVKEWNISSGIYSQSSDMTVSPQTKKINPKTPYPNMKCTKTDQPIILKGSNIFPQPQAASPREFGSAACPNHQGWHFEVDAKVMFLAP